MSDWRPISGAPMDLTPVLLFVPPSTIVVGVGSNGTWEECFSCEYSVWGPTHWMPLPEPPNVVKE